MRPLFDTSRLRAQSKQTSPEFILTSRKSRLEFKAMSNAYYDRKKRKYIVDEKEFPESPGALDYLKEGFQDTNTRVQLEALRKRRQSSSGQGGI
jgi:hypothetical protein